MTTKSQLGNRAWGTYHASKNLTPTRIMDNYSSKSKTAILNSWFFGFTFTPAALSVYKTKSISLSNTVISLSGDYSRLLEGYYIFNPDSSNTAYVQIFDASAVTLGLTKPKWSLGLPAGYAANLSDLHMGPWNYPIQIAATATSNGSSAPSTPVVVNFGWR